MSRGSSARRDISRRASGKRAAHAPYELAWVHDQGIRVPGDRPPRARGRVQTQLPTTPRTYLSQLARGGYSHRNSLPGRIAAIARRAGAVRVARLEAPQRAVALDGGGELDLCLSAQSDETRNGLLYQHSLYYTPFASRSRVGSRASTSGRARSIRRSFAARGCNRASPWCAARRRLRAPRFAWSHPSPTFATARNIAASSASSTPRTPDREQVSARRRDLSD